MAAKSGWALTPRQSVEHECARRGAEQVVAGCIALLQGRDADDDLIMALGGPMGWNVLTDGPAQRHKLSPAIVPRSVTPREVRLWRSGASKRLCTIYADGRDAREA